MVETLILRKKVKGHNKWVTLITTPIDNSNIIISRSRDKSILVRNLTKESIDNKEGLNYDVAKSHLTGHSHSSRMSSFIPMASSSYRAPRNQHCAYGISMLESPSDTLSTTPRTFSTLLFLPTTNKSSRHPATN